MPSPIIRTLLASLIATAGTLVLTACTESTSDADAPAPAAHDEVRTSLIATYRERLAGNLPAEERATLEHQLARLERGESALDEKESLAMLGYSVTEATTEQQIYRSPAHGYQVTLPANLELQEHRNGQFVMIPEHGTFFGIWMHDADPIEAVETELLGSFERWCGEFDDCARDRAQNGGALRLVPMSHGPFDGYKAVAVESPDTAPARFYAFKSPKQQGYFGFNLTPDLAGQLVESLQPLTAAPAGK